MDLKTFYSSLSVDARDEFAKACGTSRGVMQNVMYGVRPCATDLAVAIERESNKTVKRWDLRPDDWHKHWPELIGTPDAPKVPNMPPVPGKGSSTPDRAQAAARRDRPTSRTSSKPNHRER